LTKVKITPFITSFSDQEKALIDAVANERDITFDDAVSQLASEEIARRIKKNTGRNPASNVRNFRQGI